MSSPLAGKAMAMHIELLYFTGCPGYERVLPLLKALAAEAGAEEEVELHEVETLDDAERLRFLGSPTIRVDGADIEPGADRRTDFGLKCRLYRSGDDAPGQPGEDLIRAALAERS